MVAILAEKSLPAEGRFLLLETSSLSAWQINHSVVCFWQALRPATLNQSKRIGEDGDTPPKKNISNNKLKSSNNLTDFNVLLITLDG